MSCCVCTRGRFWASEEPQRWALAARDRWQTRFLRAVAEIGHFYEERAQWDSAIALYEQGIEVDALAEDLYRRLMHCHLKLGVRADAARTYRRCREMLSIQLGIAPSADTEALFQSIYGLAKPGQIARATAPADSWSSWRW